MSKTVRDFSLGFVGLGCGAFIANLLQLYCFGVMGEHLTMRLRQLSFSAILRQVPANVSKSSMLAGTCGQLLLAGGLLAAHTPY